MLKSDFPKVMGIINITPDSFYSESRRLTINEFISGFERMVEDGVDIVDIGACSTRPGSVSVSEEEEWMLLKPAIEVVSKRFSGSLFSVDTFRAEIVERVYDIAGNFIVNDISAGEDDSEMLPLVAKLGLPYIAMHKRGTPQTMQSLIDYDDIVQDIRRYFEKFISKAKALDINDLIIDPGFGFAKTIEQNYSLLNSLRSFKFNNERGEEYPLLVGLSRKGMIWKLLSITPEEALPATTALNLQALLNGADILRVHDVKEAKQVIAIYKELKRESFR